MSVNLNLFNLLNSFEFYRETSETKESYNEDGSPADFLRYIALILFLGLALLIYSIVILVVKWKYMPTWARALAIFSLFIGTPFTTIMIVYLSTIGKGKDAPTLKG